MEQPHAHGGAERNCWHSPRGDRHHGQVSTRDVPAQIDDLPRIGRPANSALLAAGVTTLDEVAQLSEAELLALTASAPARSGSCMRRWQHRAVS